MKMDKISFGTKPSIGCLQAKSGLSKYGENLTDGIAKAFAKLSENPTDDFLDIRIGQKIGAKNRSKDSLGIYYCSEDTYVPQSSIAFNPKTLAKLSPDKISEKILKAYENLKKSTKIVNTTSNKVPYNPQTKKNITESLLLKIKELTASFGSDDNHLVIN